MPVATAYPLERLGPHWVDRLVSAMQYEVGTLDEGAARQLLEAPIEDFPRELYPEGGVARILEATACHPYLIQFVADRLTHRLNEEGRVQATHSDIRRALDRTLSDAQVFPELWRQWNDLERRMIRQVARAEEGLEGWEELPDDERETLVSLEQQYYLTRREGRLWVSVPLVREWIQRRG